jgi:hypothetical protein
VKIYRRENVPCVSQTKHWKGLFEEHFLSAEEINIKYPILNPLWRFVDTGVLTINNRSYSTIYCAKYFDFHQINQPYTDPWYRELKHDYHIYDISEETAYLTTVESNAVLLKFEKTKL